MRKLLWRRDGLFLAGLLLLVALVYCPMAGNNFVNYDDDGYVIENEFVNQGLTLHSIAWAMTTFHESNWHPLTWLSHMLDCQMFGLAPGGHHAVSLVLHAVNVALLYLILARMTFASWPSAVVAAFFAVHPLHVESVAWIAERKDVLSTLFGLVAIWLWLNYLARPNLVRYMLVMLAYAASLMSKPMLVTLPILLLLLDYWPLERMGREQGLRKTEKAVRVVPSARLILEKLPLLALTIISCCVTMFAQSQAMVPLRRHSIEARAATIAEAYCGYLEKTFVPRNLAPIYPLSNASNYPVAIACGLALATVTVALIIAGRRRRYLAVGWLWYLGLLVPVIGIVHVGMQSMADRYTYLPLVGIFILVVWACAEAITRWPRMKPLLAGLAAVALAACCWLSTAQVRRWSSTETLFTYTAAVTRDNPTALTNLGLVAIQKGDYAAAERLLREALRLDASDFDAMGNLATMFVKQKRFDDAVNLYEQINRLCPNNPKLFAAAAAAFTEQGNHARAEACLRQAIALEPAAISLRYALASSLQLQGKTAEAVENYRWMLRVKPGDLGAANNLAWILATHPDQRFRNGAEAVDLLRPLLGGRDCDSNFLDTLAAAYAEAGRFEQAAQTAATAIDRARSEGKPAETIASLNNRAGLYRQQQPYRDPQPRGGL